MRRRAPEVEPRRPDRIVEMPPAANAGDEAIEELARILFAMWQQDRQRRERPAA